MCDTCGCSDSTAVRITDQSHTVVLEQDILAKNDDLAAHNRTHLRGADVFAINLMSSPGAGKTTLLERTISFLDTPLSLIHI